jgi:hypothetical protein
LSAWETGHVSTITPGHSSGEIYNCLQWFPQLNGGAGGLVYAGALGTKYTNAALTSWSSSPELLAANYQNWIAYTPTSGHVYWGGGSASAPYDKIMYRMSATPTFETRASTPHQAGTSSDNSIILPHPNGTDLMSFQCSAGAQIHKYTASSNSWGSSIGTHPLGLNFIVPGNPDGWIGTTIHEYGVIVFLKHQSTTGGVHGTSSCIVYKP